MADTSQPQPRRRTRTTPIRKRQPRRVYLKGNGFYGDFRSVGGKQEALITPGASRATTDPDVAAVLYADRLKHLEAERRGLALLGRGHAATLAAFAAKHLEKKAEARRVTEQALASDERALRRAVEFFGVDRPLTGIGAADVEEWLDYQRSHLPPRGGGESVSNFTLRHHLNALSNLYRRAQAEGVVPPGFNPPAAIMEKPSGRAAEARWLEVHEAALLLEACRHYQPPRPELAPPLLPLVATFLLTGGRLKEVLGLAVTDVSFQRETVTFREHAWRRLKTLTSARVVPLWPQFREILQEYLDGPDAPAADGLLFPSDTPRTRQHPKEQMLKDFRKTLDGVAKTAGWQAGDIRTKMFRHTYCSARLQTLDHGAPVSPFTVARELGHGGMTLVNKIYGHLGNVRHRAEVVEYPVETIKAIPDKVVRKTFVDRLRAVRKLRLA
jgi:integrase